MKLDDQRQIINFREGCIKDLKETLNIYKVKIDENYLEDFVNEVGELCYYIISCNQAIHYHRYELELETEKDFIKLREEEK